jgi:hypothetical protein
MKAKPGFWGLLALAALAGSSFGQHALDRSLQVGSGGINGPGRDIKKELEFRNAIVTGNAPGGISFRGDVGYRAPGEFFGRLGSNDTFAFRRDSAYSGLGGLGLRGTDALQYQFAVTTGNSVPTGLTGIPIYQRAGSTPSTETGREEGFTDLTRPKLGEYGSDTRGLSLMSVRSPSAYVANRVLQPTFMGKVGDEASGARAITASMLRGVAFDDVGVLGLKPEKDEKKEPKTPSSALPDTALNTAAPSAAPSTAADARQIKTAYQDLMERVRQATPEKPTPANAAAPDKKEAVPEWQRRLNELRDQLREKPRPVAPKATKPDETKPTTPTPAQPGDKNGEDGEIKKPVEHVGLDTDTVEIIKRAGERVSALAPASYDAYGTQMKAGQDNLAAGRYFDAEERFTAALSTRPGDPMAMVGRVHAQIGAGMFLSAAINLRGLLTEHPELASTKYGETLLPAGERKGKVVERLDELIAEQGGRGRDPGLLLAYMGYQLGDAAVMNRGLKAMTSGAPAEPDQLSRLAELLSKVWTESKPAGAPAGPPPAAPTKPPEKPK